MTQDLFPRSWLVNTLLDEGFVARKIAELTHRMTTKRPEYLALLQ